MYCFQSITHLDPPFALADASILFPFPLFVDGISLLSQHIILFSKWCLHRKREIANLERFPVWRYDADFFPRWHTGKHWWESGIAV